MPTAQAILDKTRLLLAGSLSFREFEDWFVPYTWNIHKSDDEKAKDLAYSLDLLISEYTDSLLTKDVLMLEIADAIRTNELLFPVLII